jgi:dTDP-4-amino-4,6-dideoxygalactose transaminase
MDRIPFVDLHAQYLAHREEFDAAFAEVIARTAFIGGEYVRRFEQDYVCSYGVSHCVSVANGTDAIYIVLRMLGVGPGDEVITTAASWISTSETITQAGARPVFVDVDEYSNIDVARVEAAITPRTRVILPVHLYGQAAAVEQLADLAAERGLHLVEDCAQAHFAERMGRRVGTWGVAGTFSFYPGKNLGAWGDAGAIVTGDARLAEACRMYANHGALVKHEHRMEGINSRMDGLQAALLSCKLRHLDDWTRARQRVAAAYDRGLANIAQVERPKVRAGSTHVYHLYVVQAERRDALRSHLAERGIETAIHYPTALPLLSAYDYLGMTPAQIPRAAANQSRILSLPIYPEMTDSMVERVVVAVKEFYGAP